MPTPPRRSYGWAVVSFASGAGLIGASFTFSDAANRRYQDYLQATDPGRITRLYDEAVRFDRLSTAALVGGEALIATGLYLAFLRRPEPSRLDLVLEPARCGVALRF